MLANNHAPIPETLQKSSGFNALLLGHALEFSGRRFKNQEDSSEGSSQPVPVVSSTRSITPAIELTELHRQLSHLILTHPFWNDYRLLDYVRKSRPESTMQDLLRLKQECRLDDRQKISGILLRLVFGCGKDLSTNQLRFIFKVNPELLDRDLRSGQPGELLVYECFCVYREKGIGKIYIHLFVDMFNSHAFGILSQLRTFDSGLKALQKNVLPLYQNSGQTVQTILYSTRTTSGSSRAGTRQEENGPTSLNSQWIPTCREFGVIQKFRKALLTSRFFEGTMTNLSSLADVQIAFAQWLKKYNAANRLLAQRS
jgi:hypothetical protein